MGMRPGASLGLIGWAILLLGPGLAAAQTAPQQAAAVSEATIARQVPLRIVTTRRTKLKRGAPVAGKLLEPVFVGSQLVLPAESIVTGHVASTLPVDRATRRDALLNGDLTPLRVPVVAFDSVRLTSGVALPMDTLGHLRQAELIRFVARKKQSRLQQLKAIAADRIRSTRQQFTAPHKTDRLMRFAYNQLLYHPQRIWAETDFDAELQTPLVVPVAAPPPVVAAPPDTLLRVQPVVRARLTEGVSSDTAKNGDVVHAVLTQPAWDGEHRLIFPEGAALTGVVLQAKPSRRLGHNGRLRFAFRSMEPAGKAAQPLQGQVTGAEGQEKANVTVDEEGGVQANPDKDRFLGPLLLAVLAAGGHDDDGGAARQGLASNGLGIVVRVVGLTAGSRNFATGVGAYGFAKSVYRHFLAHGKPVAFPRDTAVEVQLSERR